MVLLVYHLGNVCRYTIIIIYEVPTHLLTYYPEVGSTPSAPPPAPTTTTKSPGVISISFECTEGELTTD